MDNCLEERSTQPSLQHTSSTATFKQLKYRMHCLLYCCVAARIL